MLRGMPLNDFQKGQNAAYKNYGKGVRAKKLTPRTERKFAQELRKSSGSTVKAKNKAGLILTSNGWWGEKFDELVISYVWRKINFSHFQW